jgi:hypothetical protein
MLLVDIAVSLVVLVAAGVGLWCLYSTLRSGNWRNEE